MPWWGWIVVGAVLLAAELFVIPTDFFLVFLGTSAVVVGLLGLLGVDAPVWAQWAIFGVLSVVSLVFFRGWLKARLHRTEVPRVDDTLVGEIGVARESLAPGAVRARRAARNRLVGAQRRRRGARVRCARARRARRWSHASSPSRELIAEGGPMETLIPVLFLVVLAIIVVARTAVVVPQQSAYVIETARQVQPHA